MSRLKAIEVANFMSIESARLEFDDSNIISICGYNDSGKSALTRLLEIMFYNAYSQDQVSFIKDGADYWGCSLEFDDGVEYNRYKYLDGKSEYELKQNGKTLFSNRSAQGTLFAMDKVPEQIENYLGVISVRDDTMNEKLNVRRNTDKLFLINTTGGENYKMLNVILRSDILATASKKLSQDRNGLQSDASIKSTTRDTLQQELNTLEVCSEETLDSLEEKTKKLEDINRRYEYLRGIKTAFDEIDKIVIPKELKMIDSSRLAEIKRLQDLYALATVKVEPECKGIDTSRFEAISEIIKLQKESTGVIAPECKAVSLDRFKTIKDICVAYNELYHLYNAVDALDKEIAETRGHLESLAKEFDFKICKNCGTVMV